MLLLGRLARCSWRLKLEREVGHFLGVEWVGCVVNPDY